MKKNYSNANNFTKRVIKIMNESIKELKDINIPIKKISKLKIMNNISNMGYCKRTYKGMLKGYIYTIAISKILYKATDKEVKEVVIHELLHTCNDCFNHGKQFKFYGLQIQKKLNINVSRTFESQTVTNERAKKAKYVFKCKECGNTILRFKNSKFVQYYDKYKCGACKGKFERIK